MTSIDPPAEQLLYSVLVVNYQGAARLDACLTALARQTFPRHRYEVVVLDNASTDDSLGTLRRSHPWCRVVVSRRNLGFAEGNNVAASYARAAWLVLLNNDTVADPFWLEELHREHRRSGAAVVSKLVFAHDATRINSAGLTLLRDGRGADRGFRQVDVGQYEQTESVFAGCGAALVLPRPRPGETLFDPDYFLYYEDLDAVWRRQLRGLGTRYAPRSLVRHAVGADTPQPTPLFRFCVERNRMLTSLRNGDTFLALYSVAVLAGKVAVAGVRSLVTRRRADFLTARTLSRAGASGLAKAPAALVERWILRSERRR